MGASHNDGAALFCGHSRALIIPCSRGEITRPAGPLNHTVCAWRRGADRERSCRRQDRILDGNRRPDYEPGEWCDLSWDSASDRLDAAWVSCTTPARDAHVA